MIEIPLEMVSQIANGATSIINKALGRLNEGQLLRKEYLKATQAGTSSGIKRSEVTGSLKLTDNETIREVRGISIETTTLKINNHLEYLYTWASTFKFNELAKSKKVKDIHIALDTYLIPRKFHQNKQEASKKRPLIKTIVHENSHTVVLGTPGAGKTTSMRRLVLAILEKQSGIDFDFPIAVRLRELNARKHFTSIFEPLYEIFDFNFELDGILLSNENLKDYLEKIKKAALINALNSLKICIIFDGFDEISEYDDKERVISELEYLCQKVNRSRIILTCRTNEYPYSINNTTIYEISELSDGQIKKFLERWTTSKKIALELFKQIKNSPFSDTAIKPLTLAHLCAIYDRTEKIPEKPKDVYSRVVKLMIEDWDEQRRVLRKSRFADFDSESKRAFLVKLAYNSTVTFKTSVFEKSQLKSVFEEIRYDYEFKSKDFDKVFEEIEANTGLLLEIGYELYEFSHKSIQEFLTAEYIAFSGALHHHNKNILNMPNELAIATAICTTPATFLADLIFEFLSIHDIKNRNVNFLQIFINRLLLEKPRFNISEELTLSAFHLLNSYPSTESIELFEYMTKTQKFSSIYKYYDIHKSSLFKSILNSSKSIQFFSLKLKKHHDHYTLSDVLHIPQYLIDEIVEVDEDFLAM